MHVLWASEFYFTHPSASLHSTTPPFPRGPLRCTVWLGRGWASSLSIACACGVARVRAARSSPRLLSLSLCVCPLLALAPVGARARRVVLACSLSLVCASLRSVVCAGCALVCTCFLRVLVLACFVCLLRVACFSHCIIRSLSLRSDSLLLSVHPLRFLHRSSFVALCVRAQHSLCRHLLWLSFF